MKNKNKRYKKNVKTIKILLIIILLFLIYFFINNDYKKNNIVDDIKKDTHISEKTKKDNEINSFSLILVNKENKLPNDFTVNLKDIGGNNKIDERIYDNFINMMNAAKSDNIDLLVISSYRTVERSEYLFNRQVNMYLNDGYTKEEAEKEAEKWVARPYTSEHHTGLALDIVTPTYTSLDHGYKETKAAKWLFDNAYKYGFVLRYPEDKIEITKYTFEPWHYRFVGISNAKVMKELNLCLEEYLEYIENDYNYEG